MVQSVRPRTGRKPQAALPGARVSLGLKVEPEIKNMLDAAVRRNGGTQSIEAAARIRDTFRDEDRATLFHDAVYGRQTAGLLEALGRVIRDVVDLATWRAPTRTSDWITDPVLFSEVEAAITEALGCLRPMGDPGNPLMVGEEPMAPAVARGVMRYVAFGRADSADDLARLGAAVRDKIGEAAGRELARRFTSSSERS